MANKGPAGHRTVPHTADLRIEAWAPTAEECVAEAVEAMVDSVVDVPPDAPAERREFEVPPGDPQDELVAVLDEVIYRMETDEELPRAVAVRRDGRALRVSAIMVGVGRATVVGAAPKAVSLHRLDFGQDDEGWRCAVTLDV